MLLVEHHATVPTHALPVEHHAAELPPHTVLRTSRQRLAGSLPSLVGTAGGKGDIRIKHYFTGSSVAALNQIKPSLLHTCCMVFTTRKTGMPGHAIGMVRIQPPGPLQRGSRRARCLHTRRLGDTSSYIL